MADGKGGQGKRSGGAEDVPSEIGLSCAVQELARVRKRLVPVQGIDFGNGVRKNANP